MYGKCNTAEGRAAYQHAGPFMYHRGSHGHWGMGYRRPKYNVPVNIAETGSSYKVYVYAIGFDKENISISVADGVLYISGTRQVDEATLPNFLRQEFPIKTFERAVMLNDEIDAAGITAKQQDGVLVITLPKTEEAQRPAQEIKVD
jgi:HSP20 family protein